MHYPPPLHVESPPPALPPVHRPLNYGALGEAIVVIAQELQHAAHGGNAPNEIRHLREDINGLIDGVNRLSRHFTNRFRRLEHSSRRLEEKINMMPLRSFNASAHSRVPVLYPYPYQPNHSNHLPRTKGELERISGVNAQRALTHLGFHPDTIPANAQQRRDMLLTHLGLKVDVGPFLHEGDEEEEEEEDDEDEEEEDVDEDDSME